MELAQPRLAAGPSESEDGVAGAEEQDLAAVYSANATRFRRLAARALRGYGLSHLAEDVVSEAVLAVWNHPPEVVDSWAALIIRKIRLCAIDRGRKAKVERADLSGPPSSLGDDGDSQVWHQSRLDAGRDIAGGEYHDAEDPAELVERDHQVDAVRAAIARLSSPDREIVTRIKLGEETGKAVAIDLGITPGRVSQILKRAMHTLEHDTELKEVR
jgi:RNA polymerase sigma factor (sigma-70 family)